MAILAPILVFGLVIFVHELGHFLAAKSVGVYAPRFSIGFGPALWRRRRGETEYILAAFPLGGYVRMASRHDEATAFLEGGSEEALAERMKEDPRWDPNAMIPFGPKPVPEHRWFESKPLWARLYILLAGVTMNILLGLVVAIGLAIHYGRPIIESRVVGAVLPVDGQPLLASAVQPGDTIVRVNDRAVATWSEAIEEIGNSRGEVTIATNRGAVTVPLDRAGAPAADEVREALQYHMPAVIGEVEPREPAAEAGLQARDSIVAINGRPVASWRQMVEIVANAAGTPLRFDIVRDGAQRTFTLTPRGRSGVHPVTGEQDDNIGRIGAYAPDVSSRVPVGVGEAVVTGTRETWRWATLIVTTVKGLVTREVGMDQLGGPIAITRVSVQAAKAGLPALFGLIGLLSVNIAIFNLLPIPVLDGGQVLINIVESARGRALSLRTREYILRGGLFFILLLFVLVMFNDTTALFR